MQRSLQAFAIPFMRLCTIHVCLSSVHAVMAASVATHSALRTVIKFSIIFGWLLNC